MKLALVHDYLNQFGGAERVVEALHEAFSEAPIFTTIYDKKGMPPSFRNMDIKTSFMQYFPFIMKHYKPYLIFFPFAIEMFNLKGFDVVLSSSSAFAKGVKVPPGACHICYCHTPMRFAWRYEDYVREEHFNPAIKAVLPLIIKRMKMWDIRTSARVHYFIANSKVVKERIKKFYGRMAEVINPPVNTDKYLPMEHDGDYFLIVSRLNPYKRIELAVQVFNELRFPLKIVGEGPFRGELERLAKANIEFLGRVGDKELAKLYAECKALIFPGEEDFGIAPLEAASAGRPTIAFRGGGALETIISEETGIFFNEHREESLRSAVKRFENLQFNKEKIRNHALSFSKKTFQGKIIKFIEEKYKEFKRTSSG